MRGREVPRVAGEGLEERRVNGRAVVISEGGDEERDEVFELEKGIQKVGVGGVDGGED